jgi:hypothetical protein
MDQGLAEISAEICESFGVTIVGLFGYGDVLGFCCFYSVTQAFIRPLIRTIPNDASATDSFPPISGSNPIAPKVAAAAATPLTPPRNCLRLGPFAFLSVMESSPTGTTLGFSPSSLMDILRLQVSYELPSSLIPRAPAITGHTSTSLFAGREWLFLLVCLLVGLVMRRAQ